jgi:diguanylate cyclase (GGDEF)-like protein/PAS domain S-box-containing protein
MTNEGKQKKAGKDFRVNNSIFRILTKTAPSAIFICQDEKFCYVNPAMVKITGYTKKELSTMNFCDIAHPDFWSFVKEAGLARLRDGQMPFCYEAKILTKSAQERWINVASTSIQFRGRPAVLAMAFDITERKQTEKALLESKERYRAIVEDQTELICRFTPTGTITFANNAFYRYFTKNQYYLDGKDFYAFIPVDEFERVIEHIISLNWKNSMTTYECRVLASNGEIRWQRWSNRAIFDSKKRLIEYQAVGMDITDRKKAEEELRALAFLDELTGLYNRRGFFTLVEQELKIANRLKKEMLLLYFDVDGLKVINDTFGHQDGDIALIDISYILKETFRESDIIARIGGDEFVVLAIQTDDTNTEILHTRLQDNITSYNAKGKRRFRISISMGIVSYHPESHRPIHDLLREADTLMYEQKQKKMEYLNL